MILDSGLGALIGNRFVTPLPWSEFSGVVLYKLRGNLEFLSVGILEPVRHILTSCALLSVLRFRAQRLFGVLLIAAIVIVVPVIITTQRVVPPDRVWLFLKPLYLGTASAGLVFCLDAISSLVRRLTRVYTNRVSPAIWATSMLALIGISWHAWSQQALV